MPSFKIIAAATLALFLVACSSSEEEVYEEQPVDTLYNAAMEQLLSRNYEQAAEQFEEVERQHPYSVWAAKAQVMGAYAYFRKDRYDDSINAADRFIQLHPTSADAPYAYYLKALAYYEQIVDVGRDQRTTERALEALSDVTRRFPETQYARDASLKLDLTKDHLAGREMSVGRFYLKRGELAAAVNRFKRVIERHQTTSHVPEALLRLTEAYRALGLENEARRMTAILGHNYPGSPWYADAYELVENVKLDNFPRPEERAFYERWVDPDATIAKAEQRDIPVLAPPRALPSEPELAAAPKSDPKSSILQPSVDAKAQTPGEARNVIRKPLGSNDLDPKPEVTLAPVAMAKEIVVPSAYVVAPVVALKPGIDSPSDPVQPDPPAPPIQKMTTGEKAALIAEAESQTLSSREVAGEWRRAAAVAQSDDGRRRAETYVTLAEASSGYWAARAAVARAETSAAEAQAERLLAERSVTYWAAAADAAEDDLAKQYASESLVAAERVLAYWQENGRRPSWLERTVRSVL
ncbi:MAG: outer membrane protein assembly factor BamD [Alphaproteobacteria bacterium]